MDFLNSKATFVIPYYNQGCQAETIYLEKTINGIFKQTDKNWQIVIIDDASLDSNSKVYLKKLSRQFPEKINVIFSDVNEGPGIKRNTGIEWACRNNSPFILFNDADDISDPRRLEIVRNIFLQDPDASIVYSTFKVIDENDNFVSECNLAESILEILEGHRENPVQGQNAWIEIGTKKGYTNLTSSTAVKTELAYKHPFPAERVSEDFYTWMTYSADGGKFIYSSEIPSLYRIPQNTEGSSSRSREHRNNFYIQKARVDEQGFKAAIEIAKNKMSISEHQIDDLLLKFYIKQAVTFYREKETGLAKDHVTKALNISEEKTKQFIFENNLHQRYCLLQL